MGDKSNLIIEYSIPIESSAELGGDFTIQGIAINETTTSNNHKFLGEELRKAASTLIGVPLLKDHNNSVDAIVGRVQTASFNEELRNIPFKAVIKDPTMIKLVKDRLINSVSVGAHVDPNDIDEGEDGEVIPRNIEFKELSLVAIGADPGASFDIALNNAYKTYKSQSQKDNSNTTERGSMNMTKEEKNLNQSDDEAEEVKEDEEESKEEEKSESNETSEKILTLLSTMDKRLSKIEESDVDEVKPKPEKEKAKPKAKEEDEEEVEDSEDEEDAVDEKYTINQKGGAFTYERKSYVYN